MSSEPHTNTLEQFADIEAIRKLTVSRDSKRILFLSVTSGSAEAHSVTVVGPESGKRRKEFNSSNSVANAHLLSDGSLLFESDVDGNELNQIQTYANGKVTGITKEGARCLLIKVDSKEEWAYFLSSERDPMALDTKRVNLKNPDIVEMVYESRDGMMLEDVSDDGRYLAMKKFVPGRQRQPFIFDSHNKTLNAINTIEAIPPEIDTRDVFGPGNILYTRDWTDREFHIIRSYDPNSKSLSIVHEGIWNIELFEVSKSGRYHAYTVNADSHLMLRIYDTQTQSRLVMTECESLFVRTFCFFPDESKIAFTANNCKGPINIYTFDLKTGFIERWTDTGKGIVSEENMKLPESTRFESFDGMEIPAFYYKPSGTGPFPAVFLAHGGPGGQSFQSWDGLTQYCSSTKLQ